MKAFILFFSISLILLGLLFLFQTQTRDDGKLHIVFCDVGQGDAVLIRTPSGSDMLFDGGPDKKVLSCLSEHMPFWDRNIELIFLSHPHADHLTGLIDVIERYTLAHFVTEDLVNDTAEYRTLFEYLENKQVRWKNVVANERFRTPDGVTVTVLGPTEEYLALTSPDGRINSREFASLILHLRYGEFDLLLTGDSQSIQMEEATSGLGRIDVLQVPHHGSKTGLTSAIAERLSPKVAVISVGKNNYGHPAKETVGLLQSEKSMILRTDREGNIEIVTDGKTWEVR